MKKILFVIIILLISIVVPLSAQAITETPISSKTTPTPTKKIVVTPSPSKDTPTASAEQDRIEKIKEMVAEKVSKLKLVEKQGLLGSVTETTTTQITITDDAKNPSIIDIDELTKFQDTSSKTFGISDIKKGDYLSFVGLYNKETKRLLARVVTPVKSLPLFFEGVILDKDAKNFTLNAVDGKGVKKLIDFQNSTKTQSYSKDNGTTKSGFSKIEAGQRIFVSGFADKQDANKIVPSRVIYFIDLPPSENMNKFKKIVSPGSDTPVSSGSGVKLQPLK